MVAHNDSRCVGRSCRHHGVGFAVLVFRQEAKRLDRQAHKISFEDRADHAVRIDWSLLCNFLLLLVSQPIKGDYVAR